MNNEDKILGLLETLVAKVDKLEQGQTETNARLDKLEQNQVKLEHGLVKLEHEIRSVEKCVIGEINLQVRYVLEGINRAEAKILSRIKKDALISK